MSNLGDIIQPAVDEFRAKLDHAKWRQTQEMVFLPKLQEALNGAASQEAFDSLSQTVSGLPAEDTTLSPSGVVEALRQQSVLNSDGEVTSNVNNDATDTGSLSVTNDPPVRLLEAGDSPEALSGNVVDAPVGETTTLENVQAPTTIFGGSVYARHVVYSLTLDGATVIDGASSSAAARDGNGDVFMAQVIPPARALESFKLEVTPSGNDDNSVGYRLYIRDDSDQ